LAYTALESKHDLIETEHSTPPVTADI